MAAIRTILHPTDFSEHSRHALDLACSLARENRARLILLHVLPCPADGRELPSVKNEHLVEDLEAYRREMTRMLDRMRQRADCPYVEAMVKEGAVAGVIVKTAYETPCDMIVMGTHGKSRMFQMTMGSVAAEVTRQAPCPVVAVHIPAARPDAPATAREPAACVC